MILLLIASSSSLLLLSALSNNKSTIVISAIAKKKDSMLSLSHHKGTMTFNGNTNAVNGIHTHSNHQFHPNKNQKILHSMNSSITMTSSSSPSTISLSPSSERSSDLPAPSLREQQAIFKNLYTASAIAASGNGDPTNNDFKSQTQEQPCLDSSYIDKFILSLKESRFTHIRPCVTVTGTVISGQKINADGDISFNIAVDPPYQGMLGPGNLDPSRATSTGEHGIHIEVICQEPVISKAPMDIGACNGYNGPDFHSVLPSTHQHVMITGRFQIEWNESPGGLTEIHPVYAIKTIPTSS
jgi:hypothetical protein